jgi:hypothetical protein
MKKIALFVITTISLISCDTKSNGHIVPSNATGYTIRSSANIDLVKNAANALAINDTNTFKNCYISDVIIRDNNDSANLTQTIAAVQPMFNKGIIWKLNKIPLIWETVVIDPDEGGATSYVISFRKYTLTKGGKSINVRFLVVDDIRDGKIIAEWLRYDKSGINEMMK